MRRTAFWFSHVAAMLTVLTTPTAAQQWTRFRGPNGTGVSSTIGVPTEWSDADFRFSIELPGKGHSSPVLWGNRIFLTSAENEGNVRVVLCVSAADGAVLWSRRYESTSHRKHNFNSFASPTPVVDEDRVYCVWSVPDEYAVRAFDHNGNELWHQSLGPYVSQHSCGTSPILYENMIILGNDQDGPSFLIALDKATGNPIWQTPRAAEFVAYSTPCIFRRSEGAAAELIFNSGAHGMTSIDPGSGAVNWEIDVLDKRSVSSPVIAGDVLICSCGSGAGGNYVSAIRPGSLDQKDPPEQAYKIAQSAPYVPTPVYKDGLLFLWSDKGVVTCVQAASGEVHWRKRVGGGFFGSPIWIDQRIFCVSADGVVTVVAASDEYELLARNPLPEGSHSTPAVADGTLYLRTFSHLYAVGPE